jgi:leucyl aminopeptidase
MHDLKDTDNFKFTNTPIKRSIDTYVYIICDKLKESIKVISRKHGIKKIPKKLFDCNINDKDNNDKDNNDKDNNLLESFEKKFYTDDYEIIFIGISSNKKCSNETLYEVMGKLGKRMHNENHNHIDKKNRNFIINLVGDDLLSIKNQVISYILGYYEFTDLKTNSKSMSSKKLKNKNSLIYFYHKKKKFQKDIENFIYEGGVQNELRSLINIPANILTSDVYTKHIRTNLQSDIKITALGEKQLKKLGCNLILGVNAGSKNPPIMLVLEYGKKTAGHKTVALIGKGVMFDSGGYNLKHGNFSDMKNDMTGSAIVYGVFRLLSHMKVKGHFIGILPLVENMVSSDAVRPGDILTAYNGKTVEITDTDAEGRLIMADALAYSSKYKPDLCIDIATLTGQAVHIFDSKSSVIMGNNNKYIQQMIKIGLENNEKIWELPMWKEYIDLTKSQIADYKNYTFESKAGTIMAGAFLSNFVPDKTNWLHLDIAGVDNLKYGSIMRNYGATAEIMRSIFDFVRVYK